MSTSDILKCNLTLDYFKWRFQLKKNMGYHFISNTTFDCIFRYGKRGNLRESQVLHLNIKDEKSFNVKKLISYIRKQEKYDILSFLTSQNEEYFSKVKKHTLIKVPNNVNTCYKILDPNTISNFELDQISITGINFHTY